MNFARQNLKLTLNIVSAWVKVTFVIVHSLVVNSKLLLAELTKFSAHGSVTLIHKSGASVSSSRTGVPFLVSLENSSFT